MIEVGRELEFAEYRLRDIIWLAENTQPCDGSTFESFHDSLLRLIVDQAKRAVSLVSIAKAAQS